MLIDLPGQPHLIAKALVMGLVASADPAGPASPQSPWQSHSR
jgi:hypothetical protein